MRTQKRIALLVVLLMALSAPLALASSHWNTNPFTDDDQIADIHRSAVYDLADLGIIKGYNDGSFRPNDTVSRQEAATLLHRAMEELGYDFPEEPDPEPEPDPCEWDSNLDANDPNCQEPEPEPDPCEWDGDLDADDPDCVEPEPDPDPDPPAPTGGYLIISEDDLNALPTSGSEWEAVVSAANSSLVVDLDNQNGYEAAEAVAAGLVYARTGDQSYADKVANALDQIPGESFGSQNSVLSLGRHLAGWVIAADLIGYENAAFDAWLDDIRTEQIGTHGRWRVITDTHENTGNNWGTFAGVSRIAASAYLNDDSDLDRAANVFAGWLGDRSAYDGFQETSSFEESWACNYPDWTNVNDCAGDPRDGALVEDASRAGSYPSLHEDYVGEAFQGVVVQALLLERQGYDVWNWSDSAMCRAADWINREGAQDSWHRINRFTMFVTDAKCGQDYAVSDASFGRNFGFTDWLY